MSNISSICQFWYWQHQWISTCAFYIKLILLTRWQTWWWLNNACCMRYTRERHVFDHSIEFWNLTRNRKISLSPSFAIIKYMCESIRLSVLSELNQTPVGLMCAVRPFFHRFSSWMFFFAFHSNFLPRLSFLPCKCVYNSWFNVLTPCNNSDKN